MPLFKEIKVNSTNMAETAEPVFVDIRALGFFDVYTVTRQNREYAVSLYTRR